MPTRADPITWDAGMEFEVPMPPKTAERAVVLPEVGLTLRRLDAGETRYDPSGRYLETRVALPNWEPGGIESLFGFESIAGVDPVIRGQTDADKAQVNYQVSVDGGVTWLTWDGMAWVEATGVLADVFVAAITVDQRIPLLPLAFPRQIRLRAKLTPGASGRQRPVLRRTNIFHTVRLDLYEDVTRSIKRHIDGQIRVPMFFIAEGLIGATDIAIPTGSSDPATAGAGEPGYDVQVIEPVRVFNLTTDPGRLINLFGGLVGRTVSFVGPQTGKVEVQFTGVPEVFIGAEEFFQLSKIPSVVVVADRVEDYDLINTFAPERERSIGRGEGRLQPARVPYNIFVSVRVQSSLKREALQMKDAISRILYKGDEFRSVALGDHYCVLDQQSQVEEDRVAQGLFVGNITLRILGKVWLKDPTEAPLVRSVHMIVGAEVSCNLNLPSHLRNVYREASVMEGA